VDEHLGHLQSVCGSTCVGVLVGEDVEAILVDVIPHSLGISAAVSTPMGIMPGFFSVIIPRKCPFPSEVYSTLAQIKPL